MEQKRGTVEWVKHYWFAFLFLGSLISNWTAFSYRTNALEKRVAAIEEEQKNTSELINDVRLDLVEIKTSLEFIKDNVAK